jgi:hypothetical protein
MFRVGPLPSANNAWHLLFLGLTACYAMQSSAVRCSAVQCSAIPCPPWPWAGLPCHAAACNAIQCHALQCNATSCNPLPPCSPCNAMPYPALGAHFTQPSRVHPTRPIAHLMDGCVGASHISGLMNADAVDRPRRKVPARFALGQPSVGRARQRVALHRRLLMFRGTLPTGKAMAT